MHVALDHVSRVYQRGRESVHALVDVSVAFAPGELTLVLGPSGGGKSTLLHLLGGMDRPTAGRILANGQDITALSPDRLARWRRRTVGFIFQTFYLLPGLSAVDNVALPLLLDGQPTTVRRGRARSLLSLLGLADRASHRADELSGGQIQRVAIARALAHNAPLILADEPTGNLDSETGRDIMAALVALAHEDGRTVVVVSHNPEFTVLADRVIQIRDGVVAADSKPAVGLPEGTVPPPAQERGHAGFFSLVSEALRSLNRRRGRSLLTSLGVTIGVTSMVLLVSVGAGLQAKVVDLLRGTTSLTTITVSPTASTSTVNLSASVSTAVAHPIGPAAIEGFKRIPRVRTAYGTIEFLTTVGTRAGTSTLVVASLPPSTAAGVSRPALLDGRLPTLRTPGVILPAPLARALFPRDAHTLHRAVGQSVTVEVTSLVEASGLTPPTAAPKALRVVLRGISGSGIEATGYVNHRLADDWLRSLTAPHQPVQYTEGAVVAQSTADVAGIAHRLTTEGYGVTTEGSLLHSINHSFGLLEAGLGLIGGIALTVAGLMIGLVTSMAVLERRREIGVWRAVGARRGDVFVLFLTESVLVGLFGGALGDGLGWALGLLGASLFNEPGLFVVPLWLWALGLVFGAGVGALAGLQPANHAAALRPVDALRGE